MSEVQPVIIRNPSIREHAVLLDEVNDLVHARLGQFATAERPDQTPWLVVADSFKPLYAERFSPPFSFGLAPQRVKIIGAPDTDVGEWTVKTLDRRLRSSPLGKKQEMYDFYTEEHRFWHNEGYDSTNLKLKLYNPMSFSTAGYTSDFPPYGNGHALRRLHKTLSDPGLTTTEQVDERFLFKSSPLSRLALLAFAGIKLGDKF